MNQLNQPVIGVIGGAGVAAGARLVTYLEERVTQLGGYRDVHHPEMILWQATSTPSRSLFLEGRGPDFTPDFIRIVRHLKSCGADAFCMVCNTAHHSAAAIEKVAGMPLIDMIQALFDTIRVRHPGRMKVGVFCSEGSRDKRVFDGYAKGLELIYADSHAQQWITAGICGVKNQNRFLPVEHPERPKRLFQRAADWMKAQGAEVIASCCTDIAGDFDGRDYQKLPVEDSLDALADAILKYWMRQGEFDREHPLFGTSQHAKRRV